MKTKEEIKELLEFAREQHLSSIEVDGIKYTIGSIPIVHEQIAEELKPEDIVKPLSEFEELTDEEILYWATPYYDELQARKEEMKNKAHIDKDLKSA